MILPLLLACHQTEEYILAVPKQSNTNTIDTADPNWNENTDEENSNPEASEEPRDEQEEEPIGEVYFL